jgi:hypothetical protein
MSMDHTVLSGPSAMDADAPVDLLGLERGVAEELHHLRVEAGGESRVLGEVLALGDLHVAHVAEQLKVTEVVAAAVGHCLDVVQLALARKLRRRSCRTCRPAGPGQSPRISCGIFGPPPVEVLVDEPPHEAWATPRRGRGGSGPYASRTPAASRWSRCTSSATLIDADDGVLTLALRALLATGVGQLRRRRP